MNIVLMKADVLRPKKADTLNEIEKRFNEAPGRLAQVFKTKKIEKIVFASQFAEAAEQFACEEKEEGFLEKVGLPR